MAAHYDNQRVALLLLDQGASPHSAAKVHMHSPTHRGWVAGLTLPCCLPLKSSVAIDLTQSHLKSHNVLFVTLLPCTNHICGGSLRLKS